VSWAGPEFVLGIIALWTIGSLANNWIRAKHGYELEDDNGKKTPPPDSEATRRLAAENTELREQLAHFTDRVKVLERIVTDGSVGIAAQIESLRDPNQEEARP
jgi:hypothetical protein